MSYRALKRRFDLDDEYIEDLKEEMLFAYPVVDEEGRGFVWTGKAERPPVSTSTMTDGKTLPQEVLQQIIDKTDGVPLFVEEMTKAILESGHLKEVNSHYELRGSLLTLAIPATLHDSLMARLDRLVTAKAVAQYAAVIGRQFAYPLLQTVSQVDEMTLQRELGRLVEAELVYQRGVPPQSTYMFKHALIQDAAYQSLLKSTRQQLSLIHI